MFCFAKEKRFVAMDSFQELAVQMVEVSEQAQEYRRILALKWFSSMLDEDEKPTMRSPFRSSQPRPIDSFQGSHVFDKTLKRAISKLEEFIKNRKISRQLNISR